MPPCASPSRCSAGPCADRSRPGVAPPGASPKGGIPDVRDHDAVGRRSARFPWRTVGLIALLVLALVGGALLIVGTRRRSRCRHRSAWPAMARSSTPSMATSSSADSPTDAKTPRPSSAATIDETPAVSNRRLEVGVLAARDRSASPRAVDRERRLGASSGASTSRSRSRGSSGRRMGLICTSRNEDGRSTIARSSRTDGSPSTTLDLSMPVQVPIHRPGHRRPDPVQGSGLRGNWGLYLVGRDGLHAQRLDLDPGFRSDADYVSHRDEYFSGPGLGIGRPAPPVLHAGTGAYVSDQPRVPYPSRRDRSGWRRSSRTRSSNSDGSHDDEFSASWLPTEDGILFQVEESGRHALAIASLGETLGTASDLGVHGADWISSIIAPDGQSVIVAVPPVVGGLQSMSIVDLKSFTDTPLDVRPDVTWQRVAP